VNRHGALRRAATLLLAALCLLSLATPPAAAHDDPHHGDGPAVPCRDPRGCPDLLIDGRKLKQWHVDEQEFAETDCVVVEGATKTGQRQLLRFTYTTPNHGDGDLIIGARDDHPDWFEEGGCHNHPHFREYADYRLWTPEGYAAWQALRAQHPDALPQQLLEGAPHLAEQLVVGRKLGYCVIDIVPAPVPGRIQPGPPRYDSCRSNQGISVGWADEYHFLLDGQWIDVTDVAPGRYVLEVEVNAERFFAEKDYANNTAAVEVQVPGRPGRAHR
jgi:hypothetical protein